MYNLPIESLIDILTENKAYDLDIKCIITNSEMAFLNYLKNFSKIA